MNDNIMKYRKRADIIKSLAHPTRLFIVDRLSKGEICVCELTKLVGADMSTVSKHLLILKNAGIVSDDKRGLKVFYNLRIPCIINFIKCAEQTIKDQKNQDSP
jgi:ArsR family transcriptional regulator